MTTLNWTKLYNLCGTHHPACLDARPVKPDDPSVRNIIHWRICAHTDDYTLLRTVGGTPDKLYLL